MEAAELLLFVMKYANLDQCSCDDLSIQFVKSVHHITILKAALNIDDYCALCRGQCAGIKPVDNSKANSKAKLMKEIHVQKMLIYIETLPVEHKKFMKLLTGCVTMEETNVNWDEIVGLESAKDALKESIVLPQKLKQERLTCIAEDSLTDILIGL